MRLQVSNPRVLGLAGSLLLVSVAPASAGHAATWSAPATLSGRPIRGKPRIAFGTSGEGLATWSYTIGIGPGSIFGVRGAPRAASGQFGAQRELPADLVRHTVCGPERLVAVSQRDHGDRRALRVAFGSTSGRIAAARTIDRFTSVPRYGNRPELGANDRGHVAVAYLQRIRGGRRAVTLAERRPDGVAWDGQLTTEGGDDNGPFTIRVAMRPAGERTFRPARVLERNDGRASDESRVALALDPAGAAFVAWSGSDGAHARARLGTLTADGETATIRTLSRPGYDAAVREIATGRRPGEALVVWARLDAVGELGTQVLAGPIAADGAYAGEEAVSDADRARLPAAAFDPVTGAPTVVWSQRIGPDGPGVPVAQVRMVLRAATRSPTTR